MWVNQESVNQDFFFLFVTGSSYVAQTGLNFGFSFCLPSVGITGMYHHAQPICWDSWGQALGRLHVWGHCSP
jgi:hypothetical protein